MRKKKCEHSYATLKKMVISDSEEEMFDNVKLLKELGEFV